MMGYWYHFAIMFEALFILTTVDTGTRVARYILQEIIKPVNKKLGSGTWLPGIFITGGIISFSWGYLVYMGDISTIWPMFGVANQLLATVALIFGTVYILQNTGKWKYALITFLPALFMFVTTITASLMNILYNYLPKQNWTNASLSVIMLVLVLIIFIEAMRKLYKIIMNI